jgi:hypothetical protein
MLNLDGDQQTQNTQIKKPDFLCAATPVEEPELILHFNDISWNWRLSLAVLR